MFCMTDEQRTIILRRFVVRREENNSTTKAWMLPVCGKRASKDVKG